jgi:hypothetical protein
MPGGNWSSMPIVERLENDLGKPVLVNNAVKPLGGSAAAKKIRQYRWLRSTVARAYWCLNDEEAVMEHPRRRFLHLMVAAAASASSSRFAKAQAYPVRR